MSDVRRHWEDAEELNGINQKPGYEMTEIVDSSPKQPSLFEVWSKYEDIAMHFNDLLIQLRTRALAGVAALSTFVGIFAKGDMVSVRTGWEMALLVFIGLTVFWIAIWIIDLAYYNRLLIGAVLALKKIEILSKTSREVGVIDLSSMIEEAVMRSGPPDTRTGMEKFWSQFGVWTFYIAVFLVLISGCLYSYNRLIHTSDSPAPVHRLL